MHLAVNQHSFLNSRQSNRKYAEVRTMKRDWELLRWILSETQSCQAGKSLALVEMRTSEMIDFDISQQQSWSREEVYEHILLLKDGNLIETEIPPRNFGGLKEIVIKRLTMEGHDFIDQAKNETIWKKAMATVKEKGGSISIPVMAQLLTALLKQNFGLP
jgi:hypothetical protein